MLPTKEIGSGLLPTPRASDAEGGPTKVHFDGTWYRLNKKGVRYGPKLKDVLGTLTGAPPSPTFYEWIMGYPRGWTVLNLSETQSSRKSQSKL